MCHKIVLNANSLCSYFRERHCFVNLALFINMSTQYCLLCLSIALNATQNLVFIYGFFIVRTVGTLAEMTSSKKEYLSGATTLSSLIYVIKLSRCGDVIPINSAHTN